MNLSTTLKLEEVGSLGIALIYFNELPYSWWFFALLFFAPDFGMLGYLGGNRLGALTYNLFHHKGLAILLVVVGLFSSIPWLQLAGTVLFAHSSFDRIVGYGLKSGQGFNFTHLGKIGHEKTSS